MTTKPGTLYLVGTPIGNLEDITLRALRILKEVDLIACEDTRQTIKLLNHYDIKKKLIAYHKYNEVKSADSLISDLEDGKSIALVSDAGLPLISDPGSVLIERCIEHQIPVEVIPGANAALSALMLSGLDARRFRFYGFSGKSSKARQEFLEDVLNSNDTVIIYESPHHLLKTLKEIAQKEPDRILSISREITKKHEETLRGNAQELVDHFEENAPKGEFVLVIDGKKEEIKDFSNQDIIQLVSELKHSGLTEKDAIKEAAKKTNRKKREVYDLIKIQHAKR